MARPPHYGALHLAARSAEIARGLTPGFNSVAPHPRCTHVDRVYEYGGSTYTLMRDPNNPTLAQMVHRDSRGVTTISTADMSQFNRDNGTGPMTFRDSTGQEIGHMMIGPQGNTSLTMGVFHTPSIARLDSQQIAGLDPGVLPSWRESTEEYHRPQAGYTTAHSSYFPTPGFG